MTITVGVISVKVVPAGGTSSAIVMPKGKKEKKGGRNHCGTSRDTASEFGSDEDSVLDRTSMSGVSGARSIADFSDDDCTVASVADTEETIMEDDIFESEVREAIDNFSEKNTSTRVNALKLVTESLRKRYLYEFLLERKMTMSDSLNRLLKKGRGEEQALAARLTAILMLQIATSDEDPDIEGIWRDLRDSMIKILQDEGAFADARAACASSLGLCSLVVSGIDEHYNTLNVLQGIFQDAYESKDPKKGEKVAEVQAKALHSWSLLLTVVPNSLVWHLIQTHLPKMIGVLESCHLSLRLAAGEAIAVLYELAREQDEDFEGEDLEQLTTILKELCAESSKHISKKERLQQRTHFRVIQRAVETSEAPELKVRFGPETLVLHSWQGKVQYEEICQTLSVGMNVHLKKNYLIRDLFDLGAPLLEEERIQSKADKVNERRVNAESHRIRSIARNRNRDRRMPVF